MTRIRDHGWKEADRILKELGFEVERVAGDHIVYWKEGLSRPVIVPMKDSLPKFIVSTIITTGKIGRKKKFAAMLSPGKKRAKHEG